MESPPPCCVISLGGKMACTPCSIHLESFCRWLSSSWLVPAMKSSTKTSRTVAGFFGTVGGRDGSSAVDRSYGARETVIAEGVAR